MKNKSLNSIEKAISYPVRKPKALPPKTKRIIKLSKGGKPEEEKPKPKPQLLDMDDNQIETILQDLLEKGLL